MERIIINSVNHPLFASIWEIYESAFPLSERRLSDDQIRIFSNNTYLLEAWVEQNQLLGFIGWWNCENLRYVEHYAIHPDFRSFGYGSTFLSEWIKDDNSPVVLEIEPVVDEITERRKKFYQKLGFKESSIKHIQPPYHKDTESLELWILSYPDEIELNDYERFYQKQCSEIMPCHIEP